ncbi:TrmB family transcriptional regulator [Halobacteriales archaeon QS_1_68_17]|nr:MAG: TrmB family transcriptional regulator [Halobacteriales archaeon QS_1_68_17]
MDDEHLAAVLEEAGLSPYQAAVYVALLELGSAQATDLARAAEVPEPRIYDVLRDLESAGYVETYQQETLVARAHEIDTVLADLRDRSSRFREAAGEIEDRWQRPPLEDHEVSVVTRLETVMGRAEQLIDGAEQGIQLCATPGQFWTLAEPLAGATERDVDVELVVATDESGADLPDADAFAGRCTEARHRELPSPFVVLVDRTWACFAPHPSSATTYGVIVNDRFHTFVFHWFFLTCLWEVCDAVYSERVDEPPHTYLDIRECVRDVALMLDGDATVRAVVRGIDTETGDHVEVSGQVVDISAVGSPADAGDQTPLSQLAGPVNLTLDTGDGELVVGGWGAVTEAIEATSITVDRVERPAER